MPHVRYVSCMTETTSAADNASSHASPHAPESTMNRNWTYLLVTAIVRLYMLGALAISFSHIITAASLLQLHGWQAYTTPFFIDGFAVLGMIGRSGRFETATRRSGFRLQMAAGALSFACNIFAGHTIGERLYGALVVAGFVVSEWYGAKLAPAVAVTEGPTNDELLAAKRSAAAVKAAATRKARAAAQAKTEADAAAARAAKNEARRLARQVKALETSFQAADAPVSPAPLATTYM
jgi:hypothetical protein